MNLVIIILSSEIANHNIILAGKFWREKIDMVFIQLEISC